jgi:hypothetical protein
MFICPPRDIALKMKGNFYSKGSKHIEFDVRSLAKEDQDPNFKANWYNIVRYDNEQLFDVKNH